MKILTFVGAGALTLIVVSSVVFFLVNPNRLDPENPEGKIRYYTRIAIADPKIDGNQRYAYEIDAYDEKGKEKALLFTSSRPLRKGAYLELYVSRIRGVTYWHEVHAEALPERIQRIYSP